ncbi:MAG: CDP-glycerol glycerophosphotransferase, partial [Thermoplasmata archaeon]|nr:CDP-glycerol glycerophosphotransferase [Thermoplasmata archaeon]
RPTSLAGRLMQAIQRPGLRRGPDVVYGMTQPGAERVAAAARLRPEQASGAGSPRLQALTAVPPRWPFERDLADLAGLVGQRAGPVVLFLPTWGTDPALRDALLGPELLHWLDRVDGVLIAKPHPNDPPLARAPHWTDRLQVAPRSLDATLLMARADVLVTDISSAMLDMLAAGRPVVLMRLAWTEDRGYYQRPEEFVDGAVVGDGAGFAKALQAAWLLRRKGRGNASKAAAPWLPSDIEASSPQVLADLLKRIPRRPRRLG